MASYTAPPVRAPSSGARTAEMVFGGVDQAGPSFEGRVFLNRPDADETTARDAETGYVGSFHVYGYGDAPPPAIADLKAARQGAGPVAPIDKRVIVREDVLRAALARSAELVVTVVVVPVKPGDEPGQPYASLDVIFDPSVR